MQILKKAAEFEKDFEEVMLGMATLAAKHKLPTPTVVFPPEWRSPIRTTSYYISGDYAVSSNERPSALFGVTFVYGTLAPATVLK